MYRSIQTAGYKMTTAKWIYVVLLTAIGFVASSHAYGASSKSEHIDIGQENAQIKPISPEEMGWRLHVTGEIFFMSGDGEKLISQAEETREWEFGSGGDKPLISNWSYERGGFAAVALRQEWRLEKDGKLSILIQQYESMSRSGDSVSYGKLVKEERITLKDFASIDWPISSGDRRVVVRLTPSLWPTSGAIDVQKMPISYKHATVFDSEGHVWADDVTADHPSQYAGIVTHEGALLFSFTPFKGATLIGEAKRNRIVIKSGNTRVTLTSETPLVPLGTRVNVYGTVDRAQKTTHLNSVRTYSSDSESDFLKRTGP